MQASLIAKTTKLQLGFNCISVALKFAQNTREVVGASNANVAVLKCA